MCLASFLFVAFQLGSSDGLTTHYAKKLFQNRCQESPS
jgi:hypothetical protein